MIIRPENEDDHAAIHDLTRAAFAPMPFATESDAGLTDALRKAGDLMLSLVVEDDGLIGHVAFSPLKQDASGVWVGLGPVSVRNDRQRRGIGTTLIKAGLEQMAARGVDGCILIGNPAVYAPMGFVSDGRITYRDLPDKLVQWYSLSGAKPAGEVVFAKALEA
ncbi:putative acetyltransferase [Cognatiyoonia koreensis]|uniref:Putative acetyltransferase n=1 Tax=Cognatiyoonia koreensis TaxID=364200 RepID=A0A1I0RQD1_9RHOB|nr:N-acetyltransferase [Cognatiyoonia koreensis]SEW43566.1 putative acetyltransferase [Cognatiyoonia koreensis]